MGAATAEEFDIGVQLTVSGPKRRLVDLNLLLKLENLSIGLSQKQFRLILFGSQAQVTALEAELGRKAKLELLPMQAGDVPATEADTSLLEAATGFRPATPVEEGVRRFVAWYREYYG